VPDSLADVIGGPYLALWLAALPGCSLILDFSDSAGILDAPAPDSFYTAAECAYDEPDDTLQTAATVTTSDSGPAAICAGGTTDLDFYKLTVPDGTLTVTIGISYQPRGTTGDLDLSLYDASDTVIASDTDFSNMKMIVCPSSTEPVCSMLAAGDYTFEVSPSSPGNINDYTFSIAFQ
jgi:hypothetical protein